MTKCCNQHDRCYDTCGKEKHVCDEQFQECLETICNNVQRTLGLDHSVQGEALRCLFAEQLCLVKSRASTSISAIGYLMLETFTACLILHICLISATKVVNCYFLCVGYVYCVFPLEAMEYKENLYSQQCYIVKRLETVLRLDAIIWLND